MDGVIVKGIGGLYYVNVNGELYKCKARGKFRYNNLTPMIGDNVEISIEKDSVSIEKIYERKTELIRPAVANVTQAFVVFAFKHPDLNKDLLNKFLLLCEYNGLKAVVCFNKMDLVDEDKNSIKDELESAGYEVLYLEAKNNKGLDKLKEKIKDNISVFCGPSGVGKSTILNSFIGKEVMQTGEISDKLKRGKHTTRHSELIEVEEGFLVDTPGFSSLELDFISKEELQYCFKEFDEYRDDCKFNNCVHYKEPKCGVKNAVEQGKIHKSRYEFYIKTLEEIISRGNRK
ncbi:ribosome small subunit-dependent GTPase A [Clostridium argentinense CDC 2741]|uniref:Small ribosomal subunit biogenesis GTPase RsgA n=1 Tax=Clostridium argentinense CDC 2741 TaxID=1418104 RepID=A0A0C1RAD6_9CLOT|nr:ribosome small subunit-dependent GTPase A [Clostridium argentinense]ARC84672.1 ribosome small subunit-dependent GTPase A [Clostridium argentinense]KIE47396.1 ribosome small subunit-dependent GTPase A [Clostridium argentinense CDC 2741]NFF40181.1 ribosome small subunit-dependent GTPase A [Clostridium argentinense]NFP50617.1 ribosome small subunit-dependent GTPase A [Clostridium argentinense]NFP72435.1 ribosome small subunit-dependent GTPase A [Clostridium argentinense]